MAVIIKLKPCARDNGPMGDQDQSGMEDQPGNGGVPAALHRTASPARPKDRDEEDLSENEEIDDNDIFGPEPPTGWVREYGQVYREINAVNDVPHLPSHLHDEEERQVWIAKIRSLGISIPDSSHVTPQMAARVVSITRPERCTTPIVAREDPHSIEEALKWYKDLLGLLEWELQAQVKEFSNLPRPALFESDVVQTAWWAFRVPPRAIELISARYDSAPHAFYLTCNDTKRVYKDYGVKNVLYDPFLAPFWAVYWRTMELQAMSEGRGTKVSSNDLQKINIPLESFIYWIALDMRHNLLLMAESNRMDEYNRHIDKNTTPSFWTSGDLINKAKYSITSNGERMGVYNWNPDRDAMFRHVVATDKGYYITLKQQPFWCDYAPQPGAMGQGPPPKLENHKDFLAALAKVDGGWNNWDRDAFMDPEGRELDPKLSPVEETEAMSFWAKPSLLYCPENTLLQTGKPVFDKRVVTPCGPGTGRKWPSSINMGGNTNPDQARKFTKPKNTYVVLSRPMGLKVTSFEPATQEDILDMNLGCSQGCGRQGTFRYRSNPNEEPQHICPFCKKQWLTRALVNAHLETCKKKPLNWFRTNDQVKAFLPPTPSTNCGHSFCTFCANVSRITAPPYAYCTVCGEKALCIKIKKEAEIEVLSKPAKEGKPDEPYDVPLEVWQEKNPLNHHRNRYALLTGTFPAKVADSNWGTTYAVVKTKDRTPSPAGLRGSSRSPKPAGTPAPSNQEVAELRKKLKQAIQVQESLHDTVSPCCT